MNKKTLVAIILLTAFIALAPLNVRAATIPTCTFNKTVYKQGESGTITVTIYNDQDDKIQVIQLTATINYYYQDGNDYIQTFYTPTAELPVEIQATESHTFTIPFSLPNNIAPGYTNPLVKAETELWNAHAEAWGASDHPTSRPQLYIESPYKQLYETEQAESDNLQEQLQDRQEQLQDLQAVHSTTTNLMYLLTITTLVFAATTAFLIFLTRKTRPLPHPVA